MTSKEWYMIFRALFNIDVFSSTTKMFLNIKDDLAAKPRGIFKLRYLRLAASIRPVSILVWEIFPSKHF